MQKHRNKRMVLWIVLTVIIVAVIAVLSIAIWNFATSRGNEENQDSRGIVFDEDAEDWDGDIKDLSEGQTGIKIPGYGDITVPAGENIWNITLANPEDNECYFKYTITVDDEETPIYESDLIEPGKAVREFEVSKPLDPGDYEIHLNISTYSMDNTITPMNGAVVKADLHVI